jgi:hypothetical protein
LNVFNSASRAGSAIGTDAHPETTMTNNTTKAANNFFIISPDE